MLAWPRSFASLDMGRVLSLLGLGLFAAFVGLIVWNSFFVSMSYDDSYNASIAKNVALGVGYGSTYGPFHPFNPEVTTGPTHLLPVALGVALFGPQLWVPQFFTALLTLCLLGAILVSAARVLRVPFGILALGCVPALMLLTHLVDGWNRLRGDIVAGELIVLAALLMPWRAIQAQFSTPQLRAGFLAGVFLGAAIVTKLLAVLPALAVVFVAGVAFVANKGWRARGAGWFVLVVLMGLVLAPALFELGRAGAVGVDQYWNAKAAELANIRGQDPTVASGALNLENLTHISTHFAPVFVYLGLSRHVWVGAFALVCWLSLAFYAVKSVDASARWLMAALGLCALGMLFWWAVGTGAVLFTGRTQLGNVLLALWLGLLAALGLHALMALAGAARVKWAGMIAVLSLAVLATGWVVDFSCQARAEGRVANQYVLATRAALIELRQDQPHARFCGIGWHNPRVLEYALPGSGWFEDCNRSLQRRVSEQGERVAPAYLVRERILWDWQANDRMRRLQQRCDRRLKFQNPGFVISRCL